MPKAKYSVNQRVTFLSPVPSPLPGFLAVEEFTGKITTIKNHGDHHHYFILDEYVCEHAIREVVTSNDNKEV